MATEFRHQAVRDLAWVISSPPLIEGGSASYHPDRVTRRWCRWAFQYLDPWLHDLDKEPEPLQRWLDGRRSKLLGFYFEALVEFWLRHWKQVDFIASRTTVADETRGIGEFDFLFRDHSRGTVVHWETAVKYFLRFDDEGEGRYRWLGPNLRDTLRKKIDKVFGHQLRIGERPEAAPVLRRLGVERLHAEAFVKGYLFYPSDTDWHHPSPTPSIIASDHLRGWWTFASQRRIPRKSDSRWKALDRLQWLAPLLFDSSDHLLDWRELGEWLDQHFARGGKPVLLAEFIPEHGRYTEWSRGFVVPDSWPGKQASRSGGGW